MDAEAGRHRRLIPAAAAIVTILVLLALVVIIARDQIIGPGAAIGAARDAGDPDGARAALESVLQADPHDTAALAELAALARAEGRWVEAAAHWAKVARLDPLHPTARFEQARNLAAAGDAGAVVALLGDEGNVLTRDEETVLARALLMRGDLLRARAHADAPPAAQGEGTAAALLAADLAFIGGDDAAAEAGYLALLERPGAAAAAALGLAQIAMRRGQRDAALRRLGAIGSGDGFQVLRARAELYRQLRRFDLAEADYRHLIERQGPVPDAVVPLAELRASAEDVAGVAELRRALSGSDAPALAARHYLQAIEAALTGDLAGARDYLAWSGEYFGGRDLYRWLQLEVGARLRDADLAATAVAAMQRGVVAGERKARAAALLAGEAAAVVNAGDTDTAERFAHLALELSPGLPAATLVLARCALLRGDADTAAATVGPLTDDPVYGGGALEVLGRAALAAGDLALARQHFATLAARDDAAASGAYWQGIAAYAGGDPAAAVGYLREARARRADPRIDAVLLDLLIEQQDWDAAEALTRSVRDGDDAAARARGWAGLADLRRAQQRPAEAAEAFREAMAADPSQPRYALAAADLLMSLQRWEAAADVLAPARARHPDDPYLAFKEALLAQVTGDAPAAERHYRALLRQRPDWPLPIVNLSELLAADPSGADEALALARRAVALAPDWVDAHWNLAQRQADAGAAEAAAAAAREVLARRPGHTGAKALVGAAEGAP